MADEPDIAAPREVIEHHLHALGVEAELPEAALRACVAQFAQAAQPLRALLDRAAAGKQLNDEEWLRFIRGLHVLAAARDEESCPSLLRLLQRPADEVDDLLGDVITASLPAILTSLFDGDTDAFLALVANRDADDFVRGAVLTSAIHLSWTGRIERERLRTCLVHLHRTRAAEQGAYVWYAWMRAITLLDFGDLMPLVEAAWKAKWIDQSMQHWSEVRTDLARARTAYGDARRLKDLYAGPVDDVVAALDWTRPANEEDFGDADAEPWDAQSSMPAVNLFRSVGRNDPCPCGSGKKAKKCCLATA